MIADNPHLGCPLNEFIEKNINMVRKIAHRFTRKCNTLIDFDDLVAIGSIGMIKAYKNYDPTKFENVSHFSTYAYPMIEGEIRRELRDTSHSVKFPRVHKDVGGKILFHGLDNEEPEYIASKLEISVEDASKGLEYCKFRQASSTSEEVYRDTSGNSITLGDTLSTVEDKNEDLNIIDLLSVLSEDERKIAILRYQGYTQMEIGDHLGVSQAQISRIIVKIQKKLGGNKKEMADRLDESVIHEAKRLLTETDLNTTQIAQKTGMKKCTVDYYEKQCRPDKPRRHRSPNASRVTVRQANEEEKTKYGIGTPTTPSTPWRGGQPVPSTNSQQPLQKAEPEKYTPEPMPAASPTPSPEPAPAPVARPQQNASPKNLCKPGVDTVINVTSLHVDSIESELHYMVEALRLMGIKYVSISIEGKVGKGIG